MNPANLPVEQVAGSPNPSLGRVHESYYAKLVDLSVRNSIWSCKPERNSTRPTVTNRLRESLPREYFPGDSSQLEHYASVQKKLAVWWCIGMYVRLGSNVVSEVPALDKIRVGPPLHIRPRRARRAPRSLYGCHGSGRCPVVSGANAQASFFCSLGTWPL